MVPFVYFPVLSLLLLFLIKLHYLNRRPSNKNPPPSPPRLPVIGNLHQLLDPLIHYSFHSLSQTHGGPLTLFHMGSVPTLVVSSAKAASEIMKTHDLAFADRPDIKMWRRLLWNLRELSVAPYGEYWRQAKSIMVLNLLSKRKIEAQHQVREEEVSLAIEKVKQSCESRAAVNLSDLFVTYMNDVMCRVTFGKKYSEGESGRKFKKILSEFFEVLGTFSFGDFIPQLAWVDRLRGFDAKVERLASEMDSFFDGVIAERLKGGDDNRENFVDTLLKIQRDDDGAGVALDQPAIKAVLLDASTAGTLTSTTVLEWTFAELLKHPKVLKKVQDEVRMVLDGKQQINQKDFDNMKYLKSVLKETLRLHPPIPTLVLREARQDVQVMGFDISKGTRVMINAWAIARDPKVWDHPHEFEPERFLDCNSDYKGNDFNLIPFGAGRRGCPGSAFAMTSIEYLLARLLQKYDWELPNGANGDYLDMNEQAGPTVRKKVPLLVVGTPFSS